MLNLSYLIRNLFVDLNPKCYFEVGSNETLMKKYLFNNYDFDFMRSFELN